MIHELWTPLKHRKRAYENKSTLFHCITNTRYQGITSSPAISKLKKENPREKQMYAAMVLPKRQRTTFYATRWNMAPNYLPPPPPSSVRRQTQDEETKGRCHQSRICRRGFTPGCYLNKTFPLIAELPTVQLDHIEHKDQWVGPKAQIRLLREGGKKREDRGWEGCFYRCIFFVPRSLNG